MLLLAIAILTLSLAETEGQLDQRSIWPLTQTLYLHRYIAEEGAYTNLKCVQKDITYVGPLQYNVLYTIQEVNGEAEKFTTEERPDLYKIFIERNITLNVHITSENASASNSPECQVSDVQFSSWLKITRYNTNCFKFKTACGFFTRNPSSRLREEMDRLCPKEQFHQIQQLGCSSS